MLVAPGNLKIGEYTWDRRVRSFSRTTSGLANQMAVALGAYEPDTDYLVLASPRGFDGDPPVNAYVVRHVIKNLNNFNVITFATPGAGNTIYWDIMFLRP
jgi:hypothetical protein